jgi:SAM-dependent methyltransferase
MMFGTWEEFRYFECANCGSLQLENPPDDLSPYYPPEGYYSFQASAENPPPANAFRRWVKRQRDAAVLFERNGFFGWLARQHPNPGIADVKRWLAPSAVRSFNSRILDVGCGRGDLLFRLKELGFRDLTGIDPFTSQESHSTCPRILRQPLEFFSGEKFDLIMFHHAFEHVFNPLEVLRTAKKLLTHEGVCLIRLPIASEGPWRIYGTDWVEIDAPRHFFLPTEHGMSLLAAQAGLHVVQIDYEAEAFSYAASEMYRRGISLYSQEQGRMLNWQHVFSSEEAGEFERLAQENNIPGKAGRAAFYLSPMPGDEVEIGFV